MNRHPEYSQLSDLSPDEFAELMTSTARDGFHAISIDRTVETALLCYLAAAARCAEGGADDE